MSNNNICKETLCKKTKYFLWNDFFHISLSHYEIYSSERHLVILDLQLCLYITGKIFIKFSEIELLMLALPIIRGFSFSEPSALHHNSNESRYFSIFYSDQIIYFYVKVLSSIKRKINIKIFLNITFRLKSLYKHIFVSFRSSIFLLFLLEQLLLIRIFFYTQFRVFLYYTQQIIIYVYQSISKFFGKRIHLFLQNASPNKDGCCNFKT